VTALAAVTRRIRFLVALRPGFISTGLFAQMAAALDQISGGRLDLNVVPGGIQGDFERLGVTMDHDKRYEQAEEFIAALRALWAKPEPVVFEGSTIRLKGAVVSPGPWASTAVLRRRRVAAGATVHGPGSRRVTWRGSSRWTTSAPSWSGCEAPARPRDGILSSGCGRTRSYGPPSARRGRRRTSSCRRWTSASLPSARRRSPVPRWSASRRSSERTCRRSECRHVASAVLPGLREAIRRES
jgi:Luciferase-like monooxygenase